MSSPVAAVRIPRRVDVDAGQPCGGRRCGKSTGEPCCEGSHETLP